MRKKNGIIFSYFFFSGGFFLPAFFGYRKKVGGV
jgi:hypothetical protein